MLMVDKCVREVQSGWLGSFSCHPPLPQFVHLSPSTIARRALSTGSDQRHFGVFLGCGVGYQMNQNFQLLLHPTRSIQSCMDLWIFASLTAKIRGLWGLMSIPLHWLSCMPSHHEVGCKAWRILQGACQRSNSVHPLRRELFSMVKGQKVIA